MIPLAAQSFLPTAAFAVVGVLAGGLMLFWLWMAVDCLIHEPESTQKSAWLLTILFGNWIGALLYFFIRRPERLKAIQIGPPAAIYSPPTQLSSAGAATVTRPPQMPTAATSSLARPSDWTLLRLLLIILGVVVVLPATLAAIAFAILLAMTFTAVRQGGQEVAEQRRAADEGYADFQKRAAEQQAAFQKRVAQQDEDFKKRVAEQEAAHQRLAKMSKSRAEPTKLAVTTDTPLQPGDEVLCSWGPEWYRASVLEVKADGNVKIHWQNWDDFFDEDVPRSRLQLPR